jgi:hypothetical protein
MYDRLRLFSKLKVVATKQKSSKYSPLDLPATPTMIIYTIYHFEYCPSSDDKHDGLCKVTDLVGLSFGSAPGLRAEGRRYCSAVRVAYAENGPIT